MNLSFAAPGPVSDAFLRDRSYVAAIMGPIGSAKTSTCLMKILAHAVEQPPAPDGVRYSRFAVLRDTYRRMGATTLKSWHKRVPRTFGKFSDGGMNAPSVHHLRFKAGAGVVDCEVIFAAVGDNDVEDFCRGFELTGAYINEADLMAADLLEHLPGRCGRYPDNTMGGCRWRGVWMDLNAPDTESWIYRDFVDTPRDGYRLFVQPSGLLPTAENVDNLPPGYYEREARGKADWWVRRFVRNEWGYSRDGKPVYPEFNDTLHVAREPLAPVPGVALVIGADAGLTPAAVIVQVTPAGQVRILDELVWEGGAVAFAGALNRLLQQRGYAEGFELLGVCDPAAGARASTDERTWLDVVRAHTRIRWAAAPTNALAARLEAVRAPLARLIDGEPGFLLSPRCTVIRKGFNSGYRYRRIQAPGGGRYSEEPEKNAYSHPHDALQYAALKAGGGYAALLGRDRTVPAPAPRRPSDYDPFTW